MQKEYKDKGKTSMDYLNLLLNLQKMNLSYPKNPLICRLFAIISCNQNISATDKDNKPLTCSSGLNLLNSMIKDTCA